MSILRSKHSGWTWEGRRTPFGGGSSGGGQPTQSTTQTSNIPEYAKPYVETMLGAAQKQAYKYDDAGNIVGFQPYIPYGATVDASGKITNTAQEQAKSAVAGFSPMQEQAFQQTANLQVPSQYGIGSQFVGAGGMGAANIAQQAAGIGQGYYGMATNPFAQQAFMSPYMQNVVDVQKQEAMRDYGKMLPGMQAQATRQGAFGGSRQAIEAAEARRNLGTQLGQIQAQGTQKAFEAGQQAQQFGANLGLQGYNTALQGTGQLTSAGRSLADIGGQQLQAQQGIIGLQSQAGAQQQALEQQRINQAIQNYALQQQNPQMQLSLMSSLLRGLPLQQATTQSYQAAPSTVSQIGGLGAAGLGLYGMGRSAGVFGKEGGHVRKLASGGVTGMSKKVLLNPEDFSTQQVKTMTDKGMISQLVGAPILDAKMKDEQRMTLAQAAQQPKPIDTIAADIMARAAASQGIDTAESNLPVMSAFDGGIVAMADGGEVDEDGVARYNAGGRSAFQQDLIDFFGYSGVKEGENTKLSPISERVKRYFTQPRMTPADVEDLEAGQGAKNVPPGGYKPSQAGPLGEPRILPNEPKASAAAPAAPAPSVADTGGKGINDILKRFEETLGKGAEKDTEAKKMAFWSSLAQLGFGAMGGTSRNALTNIGQAGAPAVASGMQQLRDIEGRQEKRGLAQLQAALEGEKLKAEYSKLGMMQPYYKEYANYLARRQGSTGTAGLGSVGGATADKVMTRFQGYEADPKTAPFFNQLPLNVQEGLSGKYGPKTESYRRSMEEFRKYNDRAMQNYLNNLRGLSAKTTITADEG